MLRTLKVAAVTLVIASASWLIIERPAISLKSIPRTARQIAGQTSPMLQDSGLPTKTA